MYRHENRADRSALRSRAAAALWRHRAGGGASDGCTGGAGPRGHPVRLRRRTRPGPSWSPTRAGPAAGPRAAEVGLGRHLSMLHEVRRRADEFDVLHFHTDMLHFPLFEDMAGRTLTTLHGRLDMKDLAEAYDRWNEFPLVSISDDQRKPHAGRQLDGHGAPRRRCRRLSGSTPSRAATTSPSWAASRPRSGRTAPSPSPCAAGMPLQIAAKVDAVDRDYFEREIAPLLDAPAGRISSARSATSERAEFLGKRARCCSRSTGPSPSAW